MALSPRPCPSTMSHKSRHMVLPRAGLGKLCTERKWSGQAMAPIFLTTGYLSSSTSSRLEYLPCLSETKVAMPVSLISSSGGIIYHFWRD